MLQWALKYLKQGLSVIPLEPRGKRPLIPWTEFQSRCATVEEVTNWFTKWPDANIGIVTGAISGVVVVDLDGPEGLSSASSIGINSSTISLTGNGKHLWYRNDTAVKNGVRVLPGVDIRAEGGFVVVAPSIHESGRRYRWLTPFVDIAKLHKFPPGILSASPVLTKDSVKEESWIAKALQEMTYGNIDTTLHRICSRLRADNWSSDDALVLLLPHAERVGATPGHLEEKIDNAWARYEPNPRPLLDGVRKNLSRPQMPFGGRNEGAELVIHSPSNAGSWESFKSVNKLGEELRTGYRKLDAMCEGGFKSERLFTVAALSGHGKTNWAIALAKSLCEEGRTVLYFSTEYSYKKIWERYINALKKPEDFRGHAFHVLDTFTPNIDQVEEAVKQIKPDVFIFDHIQQVSKEKEALTNFMKGCQFIQRKYNTQGVVLSQLNRSADWVENGKRVIPRMSMLEGSATLEQASSRVLLLSEVKVTPEMNEIMGVLDKNDSGERGLINFGLYKNPYLMREL